MINNFAKYLSGKLLSSGKITEDDQELYIYGLFVLLSRLMYLILTCVAGIIFGCFLESIVFYISFQFIRQYAGGYHASTEARCEIMSSLSIIASVGFIKLAEIYDFQTVLLIISIVSTACILAFSPLDTPEKELSEKERKYFRKISWVVAIIIVATAVVSYLLSFKVLMMPCCVSLILESVLLVSGKIKMVSTQN